MDLDAHLPAIVVGDTRSFGAWLAGAEPRVRDSLRSFARAIDVEAVLQETLLRVWQVAPRFIPDGRANGLVRLAIRIGRNLAVSEVRRTRATPTGDADLEAALAAVEAPTGARTRCCAARSASAATSCPPDRARRSTPGSPARAARTTPLWRPASACGSTRSSRTSRERASCSPTA